MYYLKSHILGANGFELNYTDIIEEVEKLRDRRCKAIKKRLVEYNIPVKDVYRGNMFDIEVYRIELKEEIADLKWTISRVLNIPIEWIDYWGEKGVIIKEDEFNEKHCNSWREIEFSDDWSIVGKDVKDVDERLNSNGISCNVSWGDCGDFEFFIIEINHPSCQLDNISKVLNIDVMDIGVVNMGKFYIVEIKKDEG